MADDYVRVDEDMVQEWAEGTLSEWLAGYTCEAGQPQYKILHVGEDKYQVDPTYPDMHMKSRVFLVQVSVTEL